MIPVEPQVYSIKQTQKILNLGRNSVYAAAKSGDIPTIKIRGRLLVPKAALDRMLAGEPVRA